MSELTHHDREIEIDEIEFDEVAIVETGESIEPEPRSAREIALSAEIVGASNLSPLDRVRQLLAYYDRVDSIATDAGDPDTIERRWDRTMRNAYHRILHTCPNPGKKNTACNDLRQLEWSVTGRHNLDFRAYTSTALDDLRGQIHQLLKRYGAYKS